MELRDEETSHWGLCSAALQWCKDQAQKKKLQRALHYSSVPATGLFVGFTNTLVMILSVSTETLLDSILSCCRRTELPHSHCHDLTGLL